MSQASELHPETPASEGKGGRVIPLHERKARIALAGNPNSGKTTAFNAYTGSRQHVGNYPGVTVEKKEGVFRLDDTEVTLVDLPGTYSLTAYSAEEIVTREVLSRETPLAVVDVVDASALERNLLLTVQIMEMGIPVALALNMMDEARRAGMHINSEMLGRRLGVPVGETVARTGEGLKEIMAAAVAFGRENARREPLRISYGPDLDPVIAEMETLLTERRVLEQWYRPRWIAVKLLEGDERVREEVREAAPEVAEKLQDLHDVVSAHIRATLNASTEAIIADYRYGYIRGVLSAGVISREGHRDRMALTDKLDKVFTNALFGPLIMLGILYVMFQVTFDVGAYPQGWVEDGFGWLGDTLSDILPEGFLKSLVVSGIIDGVGGVVSFVPLIMIMFLFVAFLEDSGYMARIAYMVDRVFRAFGLHGCSVMPYIVAGGIAGGCAIPGVMATRTLRSPREKLATLLTLPYMACGAKLPVFLLVAGVFFPGNEAVTLFLLTLAGWAAALLTARLLRSTVIRGESTPFVMELPAYHWPTVGNVIRSMWERGWSFIKKAGTIILLSTILVWFTTYFCVVDGTFRMLSEEEINSSILAAIGSAIAWIFTPLGWGNWQAAVASITGLIAKENIVGTLGILYGGSGGAWAGFSAAFSGIAAYSFLVFNLLCAPCFAAIGAIKREMNSAKWTWFAIGYQCGFAYVISLIVYQFGSAFTGNLNVFGLIAALVLLVGMLYLLFRPYREANRLTTTVSVK